MGKAMTSQNAMKGLFLTFYGLEPHNGISKKILYQVKSLNRIGVATKLCYTDYDKQGNQVRKVDDDIIENFGKNIISKIKKRVSYSSIVNYIDKNGISFLYIRSAHNASPFINTALRKIKSKGVKIVVEIPTYPYEGQFKGARMEAKARLFFDILFRKKMSKLIDSYVTFTDNKTIFGTRNIEISNGIDFESVKLKTRNRKLNTDGQDTFNMISVSEVHYWHGLDRIIEGMYKYYEKNKHPATDLLFHVVGRGFGKEYYELQELARTRGLSDKIIFYGNKSGNELDGIFEKADFGIASLGRHRSNITKIKTLKNREYAARGIPFVYSEIDDDFEKMHYVYKAAPDDSPVDISSLMDFYESVSMTPSEIRNTIIDTLSWDTQMRKVIDGIS